MVNEKKGTGERRLTVCNRLSFPATATDDRVVVDAAGPGEASCGEPLDGHEAFLLAFLAEIARLARRK